MGKFSDRHKQESSIPTKEAAPDDFAATQKTLIIGGWTSTCGDCRQNAYWAEKKHNETFSILKGCGVQWESVTSDEAPQTDVQAMRPDLKWLDPAEDIIGVSFATEAVIMSSYQVLNVPQDPKLPEN